jgi:maltooligosyltrehalose synthase
VEPAALDLIARVLFSRGEPTSALRELKRRFTARLQQLTGTIPVPAAMISRVSL